MSFPTALPRVNCWPFSIAANLMYHQPHIFFFSGLSGIHMSGEKQSTHDKLCFSRRPPALPQPLKNMTGHFRQSSNDDYVKVQFCCYDTLQGPTADSPAIRHLNYRLGSRYPSSPSDTRNLCSFIMHFSSPLTTHPLPEMHYDQGMTTRKADLGACPPR